MPFSFILLMITHPFYSIWIWTRNLPFYFEDPKLGFYQAIRFISGWLFVILNLFRFPKKSLSSELTSGDTPYATLFEIITMLSLDKESHFVDLGCGEGHLLPFVERKFKMKSKGIEINPQWVDRGKFFFNLVGFNTQSLLEGNFLDFKYEESCLFFVAATCLSDLTLSHLEHYFDQRVNATWVISVSAPLKLPRFRLLLKKKMPFCWGMGTVYAYGNTL